MATNTDRGLGPGRLRGTPTSGHALVELWLPAVLLEGCERPNTSSSRGPETFATFITDNADVARHLADLAGGASEPLQCELEGLWFYIDTSIARWASA